MLQANPNLTRRDVKHILARTARKIDPNSRDAVVNVSINGENYLASESWITNKAGYHFHNWYGFGAIHVDNAVAMARSYQTTLPALHVRFYVGALNPVLAIPDNNAAGVTRTLEVTDDLTIANFFLVTNIDHPNTGEIGIEITSPQGTRSILLNIRSGLKTGLNFKSGNIWLKLKDIKDAGAIAAEYGLTFSFTNAAISTSFYQIPAETDIQTLRKRLQADSRVIRVTLDMVDRIRHPR